MAGPKEELQAGQEGQKESEEEWKESDEGGESTFSPAFELP